MEAIYATPMPPSQGVLIGCESPSINLPTSSSAAYVSLTNGNPSNEITIKPTITVIKPTSNGPVRPAKLHLNDNRYRSYSVSSTSSSSFTTSTIKSNSCGASPTSDYEASIPTTNKNSDEPQIPDIDEDQDGNINITDLFSVNNEDEVLNNKKLDNDKSDNISNESDVEMNNILNSQNKNDCIIITNEHKTNNIKDISEDFVSTFKSI